MWVSPIRSWVIDHWSFAGHWGLVIEASQRTFPPVPSSPPDISTVPAALLAGGLATRLRPITEKIPKAMVELAGKPFIDHQLDLLHRNGIRSAVMCLGYLGERVEQHVGDGSARGMDIRYSYDGEKLMGT